MSSKLAALGGGLGEWARRAGFDAQAIGLAISAGAAGWLTASTDPQRWEAAVAGALSGAAVGAVVARLARRTARSPAVAALLGGIPALGAAAGALVARIHGESAVAGALSGASRAVVLVPLAILSLFAARRCASTRPGSLARRSAERRGLNGVFVALAALTLWPHFGALHTSATLRTGAMAIALSCAIAVAASCFGEAFALRRIRRLAAESEKMEPSFRRWTELAPTECTDLGFGSEAHVRIESDGATYRRTGERTSTVVVGNAALSLEAFRRTLAGSIACAMTIVGVLGVHAYEASPSARIARLVAQCDDVSWIDGPAVGADTCAEAAEMLENHVGWAQARSLRQTACVRGDARSCKVIEENLERFRAKYDESCTDGDKQSCRALADLLMGGSTTTQSRPDLPRARRLLARACELGDRTSCDESTALAMP